jgi:hypothetical protein
MLGEDSVVATVARASGGEAGDVAKQAAANALTGRFTHLEEAADLLVLLASFWCEIGGERSGMASFVLRVCRSAVLPLTG